MPKPLQQGWITEAVAEALGLKGRFPVQLDEVAVPNVQALDLIEAPYGRFPVPAIAVAGAPAVAARFSYAGAVAFDAFLQIQAVMITNATAGVLRYDGGIVTPTVYATADFNQTFLGRFTEASGRLAPTGAIPLLPHSVVVGSLVNFNWTQVFDTQIPANTTVTVPLPQTVVLRPAGYLFFVRCTTANTILNGVTMHARSWPLGG